MRSPRFVTALFTACRHALPPLVFIVSDFFLAGILLTFVGAYWLERPFTPQALATLAAIMVGGHVVSLTYWRFFSSRSSVLLGKIVLGNLLAAGLYWALRGQLSGVVSRMTFVSILAVFLPLQAAWHGYYRRTAAPPDKSGAQYLRWMLAVGATLFFHRPLLSTGSVGAGDAYWYTIMVADFVGQWREGIFPVFAGQTEFAFNGAINPLRFAPGLQHLAGAIDLATLQNLPFHGLLNLALVASFIGGTATCYYCLQAVEPRTPWLALVLSLLYSLCPAVLALAYMGDLFMSVTALPYIPVCCYGAWRTLTKGDLRGVVIMVCGVAALWYFHPPIAFWATLIAALTQLLRLPREWRERRTWVYWLTGLGIFGALTLFAFTSVASTNIPAHPAYRPTLIENLIQAFPAALKPVSKGVNLTSDYQLGWTLWGAMAVGIFALIPRATRRVTAVFLAAVLLILIFLLPFPSPWLLNKLWTTVPQTVCNITFMWPMQRFYVLLAGLSVFLAVIAIGPFSGRRPWWGAAILLVFLGGGWWSLLEMMKFHDHALLSATSGSQAARQILPQNRVLTRYAFNPFRAIPSYISHGFIDPIMINRLLATDTLTEITSNGDVMENAPHFGIVRAEGTLSARRPDPAMPSLAIDPPLRLEPGRRYALKIEFNYPEFSGALNIYGTRMNRNYWMPDPAFNTHSTNPPKTFAALAGRPHAITLWTDGKEAEDVRMQFFFSDAGPTTEVKVFGRYRLTEFEPEKLPIKIERWAPYQAQLNSPVPAYLETPRMFLKGYEARVNGRRVEVARSPDALVMVPISAGENRVELSYEGPWMLRFAYFLSITAWGVVAGSLFWPRVRPLPVEPQPI